jgi:hypothetical protein
MTSPWTRRPANWGAPGHANRGDEYEEVADQIEFLSTGHPISMAYKTANTDRSSANTGSTYTDDPHLAISVVASAAYAVQMYGVAAIGAGLMKLQWTHPSGSTFEAGSWGYDPGTADWQTNGGGFGSSSPSVIVTGLAAVANTPLRADGLLIVGSTAGIVTLQWAQNAANAANTTLRKGSWLRLNRIT